jgi:hypothetical protein
MSDNNSKAKNSGKSQKNVTKPNNKGKNNNTKIVSYVSKVVQPSLPPLAIHSKFDKEKVSNFHSALDFYRDELYKQIISSYNFIKYKLDNAPYIINSYTRRVDDCHMMMFEYENNKRSSVIYDDGENQRHINMARYLLKQDFCENIANHYAKYKIHCEFFNAGYDRKTKKYRRVFIKFYF